VYGASFIGSFGKEEWRRSGMKDEWNNGLYPVRVFSGN